MLASLIASIATGETLSALSRMRRAALVYGIAALAMFLGFLFLIGAAYLFAAERLGAVQAALWFGGGFVLAGVLVVAIQRGARRIQSRRAARRRSTDMKAYAGAAALALLPMLLKSKSGWTSLVAPVLAVAAYAIYKENGKAEVEDEPPGDAL